jgi:hypothetical protein
VRSARIEPARPRGHRPLKPARPPVLPRARGAPDPNRTGDLSLTRRPLLPTELQRLGYQGWNRTSVLLIQSQGGMPATLLVSSAEGASRTHRPRVLSSRGLPVAVTPALCAARDLNPDLLIKSQLHNPLMLAARGRDVWIRTSVLLPPGRRSSQTDLHPDGAAPGNRTPLTRVEAESTSRCASAANAGLCQLRYRPPVWTGQC